MTFRTLLLENALTSCMVLLLGQLTTKVSLDCILQRLFERSAAILNLEINRGRAWG